MKEASIQKIVKKLSRLKEIDSSCVIFLGAGASVTSGIPASGGIIEYIKDSSKLSSFISSDSDDYFEIMSDLHPGERRRIFKTFIEKSEINQTYLITALLVHLGYADVVLTTNFDPLIKNTLSLINQEVTVIDLCNNVNIAGHALELPAVIYLHGEYRNVWQLNTQEELIKNESDIRSIFSHVAQNRTWIIVGYSGNDLVFDQLTHFEKFDEGLYWIGYKDEKPSEHLLKELLSDPIKNAHYVSGYDSDEFFTDLFNEMDLYNELVGRFLETIPYTLKIHHKLHETVSLKLRPRSSPPKLTKKCEIWIIDQIKVLQPQQYRKIVKSIYGSILYWFQDLFTDRYKSVRDVMQALRSSKYEEAILAAGRILKIDPSNGYAHYYRGLAFASVAESVKNPADRKSCYREMLLSFGKAEQIFEEFDNPPTEYNNIYKIIESVWANEHNAGAEILTDDSVRAATNDPDRAAMAHFENATIVQPDSSISYVVLSSVQYQNGDVEAAIDSYERGMERMEKPLADNHEFLISLYFVQNRYEDARDLAMKAIEEYPEETTFVQFLADTYLEIGETERAVELIRELIAENPDNPQYYFVLGTQLYRTAEEKLNAAGSYYDRIYQMEEQMSQLSSAERANLEGDIEELRAEAESLEAEGNEIAEIAVEEIKSSFELNPDDDYAYDVLGIIYQNKAAALFGKRNSTRDNELARQFEDEARENLRQAMEYYESAAELNPDETDYWQALFQVYTTLGMDEEANKIIGKIDQIS